MSELSLPDKVVALDRALDAARIAHAFGGALALAYYAEPRATIDIDLNLFTAPSEHEAALAALAPLAVEPRDADPDALVRDGQARWWFGRTPLDLFFAYRPVHDAMRDATRAVPFGEDRIPILSPEHLVVCKAAFDRAKDWLDIEQVLVATERLDLDEVRTWLRELVGAEDPRFERFEALAER